MEASIVFGAYSVAVGALRSARADIGEVSLPRRTRWILTRSATPWDALAHQGKIGFSFPLRRLPLHFEMRRRLRGKENRVGSKRWGCCTSRELADTAPPIDRDNIGDPFAAKGEFNTGAFERLEKGLKAQKTFRIEIEPRRQGFDYAGSAVAQGHLPVTNSGPPQFMVPFAVDVEIGLRQSPAG